MKNLREMSFSICEDVREEISFDAIKTILNLVDATSHINRKHPEFNKYADKIIGELIENNYFSHELTITDGEDNYQVGEYDLSEDLDEKFYVTISYTCSINGVDLVKQLPSLDIQDQSEERLILTGDSNSTIFIYASNEEIDELLKYNGIVGKTLEEFYYLDDLDIYIGARTTCENIERSTNRIVLKKELTDKTEGTIDCVHTAIARTTFDEYNEDFLIESSETSDLKLELSFFDHFFALNSFVQSISEFGLIKLMRESYNYSEMNFGFNNLMHSQFIEAISSIDKKIGEGIIEEFMIDVLSSHPYDYATNWLNTRLELLCERFKIFAFRILPDYEIRIYKEREAVLKDFKHELQTTYKAIVTIPMEINNNMLRDFCKGDYNPKKCYEIVNLLGDD